MASFRTLFAKLRYPTPEEGDFADEMPLDMPDPQGDGDDRNADHSPTKEAAKPKPKRKRST